MNRKDFRPSSESSSSSNSTSHSYDLNPQYDSRKSFYGKAKVRVEDGKLILRSYDTDVAEIKDGKARVSNTQSPTTVRHVKEFLKQNGYKAESKSQIERDYGGSLESIEHPAKELKKLEKKEKHKVIVTIDYDNKKSIKNAEKKKAKLENSDYTYQTTHQIGVNKYQTIYTKN